LGKVITISEITEFPDTFESTAVGQETVLIEGGEAVAETRIHPAEANDVEGFQKYVIKHNQKYAIEGKVWNREFREILRTVSISVYKKTGLNFAVTIGNSKGNFARAAFKRLNNQTSVKCSPVEIDLILAVERIIQSNSGILINSGWFSSLNLPNLNNALLQGDDVNRGADWQRFKDTQGASLSNVELIVYDDDFPNGYIIISLSKRGFLYCKKNLSNSKYLELTERILRIIYP
jgi:hypothetical protein